VGYRSEDRAVDSVVSPPISVALNPQQGQGVGAPALKLGDIIEAKVLELLGQNIAKLGVGKSIIEVQTQVALTPGTMVRLAVKNTPDGLRLSLLPPGPGGATPSASNTPQAAGLPPGAAAVLTGEGAAATAQSLTAGAAAGGSANNTATATAATSTQAAQAPAQQAQNPVAAAQAAVAVAVQSSAARQGGLAPLFADIAVAAGLPVLPEPVRQAAERLLAAQPTLDETMSADAIRQALGRSGLFLEAKLANGGPPGSTSTSTPASTSTPTSTATAPAETPTPLPDDDLKAALMVLRGALKTWLADDPSVPALPGGAAPKLAAVAELLLAAIAPLPEGTAPPASGGSESAPAAPATEPRAAAPPTPPPPYRGAPPAAQPAAAPSISADMAPRDIGKVLLGETDAAIARQTLLQAASLPDHLAASAANALHARGDASGPRWLFEVPFATPQGSTVAQFEIARDGHRTPVADGPKAAWRARFSLNLEPIGPVHAQIALVGTRAAVTLWAERPDTSVQLRDNAPKLADALRQAELEPSDVLVRAGTPPRPREPAASGRFLDRAS
jgi:hypothetical protein